MNMNAFCQRPECQTTAGCVCPKVFPAELMELQQVYEQPLSPEMPPPMLGTFTSTLTRDYELKRIADALERIADALEKAGRQN